MYYKRCNDHYTGAGKPVRTEEQDMDKTTAVNNTLYKVIGTEIFFGKNAQGTWGVFHTENDSDNIVANYLDNYEMAKSFALKFSEQAGA